MHHRFLALPLSAFACLTLAALAMAGGGAEVTVEGGPVEPVAGEETTINLRVLQHGVTPVSWPALTVIGTETASGTLVRADARAQGTTGSYVVTMVFPTQGEWALTFESDDLLMSGAGAVSVAPPVVAAPPVSASPTSSSPDALPLLGALLALGVGLGAIGFVLRTRATAGASRAAVRN